MGRHTMAKPDLNRKTDVPATISGFYYQIIIACREICKDGVEAVGVETGADIVVIDKDKERSYIEAKLHSNGFSRYSGDVIKTIYNFYNEYKKSDQIKQMIFTTNVEIVNKDKTFFDTWGSADFQEIRYIQESVLRKSIESHKECKDNYKQFCTEMQKKVPKKEDNYVQELLEEVLDKNVCWHYTDYAVENSECTYREFIQKLKFEFCNKKKNDLLAEIEKEAEKKIKEDYNAMSANIKSENISEQGAERIFCSLVKMFFDCIVENSQNKTKRKISVAEYQKCLKDYYTNIEKPEETYKLKQCLRALAYDEDEFIIELDLNMEEDRTFFWCYSKVKDLFMKKLQEEGNFEFLHRYFLKKNSKNLESEIGCTITGMIRMLAVILYKEKVSIEDVKLFFDDDLNNLEIIEKLCCCYKHAYGNNKNITGIVKELVNGLGTQFKIHDEQIIIAEANYKYQGRPCETKELLPEPYNIAQVDENYKDYLLFRSLNYKCTGCLEKNEIGCKKFWEGGGGLCKRIS